jgi:hypothetical protein
MLASIFRWRNKGEFVKISPDLKKNTSIFGRTAVIASRVAVIASVVISVIVTFSLDIFTKMEPKS